MCALAGSSIVSDWRPDYLIKYEHAGALVSAPKRQTASLRGFVLLHHMCIKAGASWPAPFHSNPQLLHAWGAFDQLVTRLFICRVCHSARLQRERSALAMDSACRPRLSIQILVRLDTAPARFLRWSHSPLKLAAPGESIDGARAGLCCDSSASEWPPCPYLFAGQLGCGVL